MFVCVDWRCLARDIDIQVASITQKRMYRTYINVTARDLLDSEADAIKVIIETVPTLLVLGGSDHIECCHECACQGRELSHRITLLK